MKALILCLILSSALPLAAGTFIPLSSMEETSSQDIEFSLRWGSLLNLGNCVYEDNLWYHGGLNEDVIRIPQLHIKKSISDRTQIGVQAFFISRHDNDAMFINLNAKRLLFKDQNREVAINPSVGYSKNRYKPSYESAEPFWGQRSGTQDSRAFSLQLPVILHLSKLGINCSAKMGYSRYSAEASYNVSALFDPVVMQDFSYGQHDILNGGITVNYPIRIDIIKVIPELGFELFELKNHKEDSCSGNLTAGISFSLDWTGY